MKQVNRYNRYIGQTDISVLPVWKQVYRFQIDIGISVYLPGPRTTMVSPKQNKTKCGPTADPHNPAAFCCVLCCSVEKKPIKKSRNLIFRV